MTIEEAIKTAIEFEKKVHALYQAAAEGAGDAIAKKVFATLAEEEQGHVAYLQSRLAEWQKEGRLAPEKRVDWLAPLLQALPGVRLALVGDGPQDPSAHAGPRTGRRRAAGLHPERRRLRHHLLRRR